MSTKTGKIKNLKFRAGQLCPKCKKSKTEVCDCKGCKKRNKNKIICKKCHWSNF